MEIDRRTIENMLICCFIGLALLALGSFAKPATADRVNPYPETKKGIARYRDKVLREHRERADYPEEVTQISTLQELAEYSGKSNVNVRMKPGVYEVTPENFKSVQREAALNHVTDNPWPMPAMLYFDGSDSRYDLRGVTIKFDTKILSELKNPSPDIHPEGKGSRFGFGVVIIGGQRLIVEGLTLTDVNNHRPASNWTNTLSVGGKHNLLRGVTVTSRGSFPYGYGDLLGKGATTLLPLNKHSAVSAHGNKNAFVDCTIHARSFGHALGTENTQTFIGCHVDARSRRTDEILEETSGPAYEHDFQNVWTEEKIQPGYVISLSEDSFRSYGRSRGQGHTMKILGCSVRGTRTGIALSGYGNEMFVSSTTVRETVLGAVRLSNNARVVNVRADLRYGPALFMRRPRRNCRVDITLVPSEPAPPRWRVQPRAAAVITGAGHKIRFGSEGELSPQKRSFPIVLGHKKRNDGARNVQLINATGLPVKLTEKTKNCRIITSGKVTDEGQNNEVVRTENPASVSLEDL